MHITVGGSETVMAQFTYGTHWQAGSRSSRIALRKYVVVTLKRNSKPGWTITSDVSIS